MMRHILRPSGKALLSAFLTFGVVFFCVATASAASGPQVILGCDPAVWQAMTAKAEAQVAYDTAVTDELVNKPDSVLTLTCFSDAAGVSAKNGGAIFSGDFTTQLQTIMPVTGGGTYNCTQIGTLETQMINQGVDTGAPFATFNDLMSRKTGSSLRRKSRARMRFTSAGSARMRPSSMASTSGSSPIISARARRPMRCRSPRF